MNHPAVAALEAIRDEAEKLLVYDLRPEIQEALRSVCGMATASIRTGRARWDDISVEVTRLLEYDAPNRVEDGIKLIEALERYRFDVRTESEKSRDRGGRS
jgi:hypothetical protein